MASTVLRSLNRGSLSSVRSGCVKPRAGSTPRRAPASAGSPSQAATHHSRASSPANPAAHRFSSTSRCPSELGCCWGSLFPLHSAVAAARLNSCLSSTARSCRALSQGT